MVTHAGARYGGPVWLVAGLVVYIMVRRAPRCGTVRACRLLRRAASAAGVVLEDPRADEARPDRRGDGRDGGAAGAGRRGDGRGGLRDQGAARRAARRRALRRGGASRGLARGGARARRGQRRRGERADAAGARPRRRRSSRPRGERGGPDRARLGATLAPAVALLLAHGRLRAPQVPGGRRGFDRRLPARSPRSSRSALRCDRS